MLPEDQTPATDPGSPCLLPFAFLLAELPGSGYYRRQTKSTITQKP